jgi:DNA-binding GntR family transcriptional regulator
VEELCEIRKSNEILAVRWAIERVTPEQLHALEDNLAASAIDLRESLPRFLTQRDAEFHELLAQASGSRRLAEICRTLRRHMFLYRMGSMYHLESATDALDGHRAIVDRLRARDRAVQRRPSANTWRSPSAIFANIRLRQTKVGAQ